MPRRLIATVSLILGGVALHGQPAPPAPRPELTTLLGRPVFAKDDVDGAIAKADAALSAEPKNVERLLAAARARDVAWQFHAAIDVYTRAIEVAPADVRPWRFRGHRYISIRQFDKAVSDLEQAVALAPSSFDATYHLGLAHYLRGDYAAASQVYLRCLKAEAPAATLPEGWRSCTATLTTPNDRVAMTDWMYRAQRRAPGQSASARDLVAAVGDGLAVGENEAYYTAIRFYRGAVTEDVAMAPRTANENRLVTVGYGIAVHHLAEGRRAEGCALLRRIAAEPNWNAFGVIAAEADLSRKPALCP